MRGKKLITLGLTPAAFLLLFASLASGYKLSGYDWTYMTNPMGEDYLVNPNCADLNGEELNAVKDAAQEWNTTGNADFAFTYGGLDTVSDYRYNSQNDILWVNRNTGSVATTYIWTGVGRYRKRIYECDMVFNDRDYTWSIGGNGQVMDVQNVATHEFGHFLCLGDLYGSEDTEKTMYGYVSYGETKKRTLHPDDIAGIQAIYGTGTPSSGKMHIADITVTIKQTGPWTKATAQVTVVDAGGNGVPQATVQGTWSGLTDDTDVFETGSNGVGECSSDRVQNPPEGACFTFTVENVSKDGWEYDYLSNVETWDQACIGGGGQLAGVQSLKPPVITLSQNHPNPFSRYTRFSYCLPQAASVTLKVYDLAGRFVATLVDGTKEAGRHEIEWRGEDDAGASVPSGIYLYKLSTGDATSIEKMTLVR